LLIKDVAREFGDRVKVVTEEYGNSDMARRFGVRRYPVVFVDDVLVARPKDFGFAGPEDVGAGLYVPWRERGNQERFKADLRALVDLRLKGERVAGLDLNDVRSAISSADGPERLPAAPLTDIAGAVIDPATLAGKTVIVEMWATWCPPCLSTLEWLKRFQDERADAVRVIAVAVDSKKEDVDALMRKIDPSYRIVMATPALLETFGGVAAVPKLFVFGPDGRRSHVFYGAPPNLHDSVARAVLDAAAGGARPRPKRVEVVPGVHLFMTPPYGDVGLDGNSVAIVGAESVLVFDSNGTPAAAEAVLDEIRRITPLPIRYLVQSHWHWDHWYGAEVYKQALPDLKIVAHEKTRAMMMGPALEFNKPGLEKGLPGYVKFLDEQVRKAETAQPPASNLSALRRQRDEARFFLEQKTAVRHTFPDVTFTDRMEVQLGNRLVRVLNYGRAVTPGDAFLHLPAEKLVVAGDLLVNPVSFALSSYPTEWLAALERIDALDAAVIIPGHGEPLRDKTLLRATMDVFRVLLKEGRAAKSRGLDPDRAGDAIMPALQPLMATITGGDPALKGAFRTQLVDWYLHRVFEEIDGPLTDAIAPIPQK
jgi:glyoxylase-like metal-dependent hydrolase (beta-lactamase superfamily II)